MLSRSFIVAGLLASIVGVATIATPAVADPIGHQTPLGTSLGGEGVEPTEGQEPAPRLYPSPAVAKHAEPPIYSNGCHSWPPRTAPKACVYGKKKASKTVMLFGDSHAAHWFGAVRDIADHKKYRMLSVTKSSCPAANLHVRRYRVSTPHTSCYPWRQKVFKKLKAHAWGQVDVAVISSWHFHQVLSRGHLLKGSARAKEWERGINKTLKVLSKSANQVILLRDSPQMPGGMNGYWRCIERNKSTPNKCGRPTKKALSGKIWRIEKRAAARYSSVTAVDLSTAFCEGRFCSPVNNGMLAFKDDNHWNQIYVRKHLRPQFAPSINTAMVQSRES